jgi:glycosyltransferase involved in cell wall biosynthesis
VRILIVATFFPPQNSIASLRSYSWAKYWSRMGHGVTVLTTKKHPRESDMHMDTKNFQVIEVGVPVMDYFLERKTQQLEQAKQVLVEPNQIPTQQAKENPIKSFLKKIMQETGIFNACRFPDFHDLWAKNAIKKVKQIDWDLVVSTAGPYCAHRIGLALKKSGKARQWIVDWRDLWTDNHIFRGLFGLKWYEKYLEKQFHKYANLITTVSEPLAQILRAKTSTPVAVILNGFDPEDYTTLSQEPFFTTIETKHIVYTGSIYKGKRDPSPLFIAIQNLKDKISSTQLKVVFAGANVEQVKELAAEYEVLDYCDFAGFLPRQDALRMQRDADVLLFLEYEAPGVEGILTGKLFEYLFAGPEIIGVGVTPETSAGKLMLETQKGEAFGKDVQKIESKLLSLLENQKVQKEPDPEAMQVIKQFEREIQAKKMLELVEYLRVK